MFFANSLSFVYATWFRSVQESKTKFSLVTVGQAASSILPFSDTSIFISSELSLNLPPMARKVTVAFQCAVSSVSALSGVSNSYSVSPLYQPMKVTSSLVGASGSVGISPSLTRCSVTVSGSPPLVSKVTM